MKINLRHVLGVLLKGSQPACWCIPPWITPPYSWPLWLKFL